jgi:predicted GNAT superfamily acetyltransferase
VIDEMKAWFALRLVKATHERGRGIAREYYGSVVYGVTWLLYTHTIERGDLKFTLITFKLSLFRGN